MTTRRRPPARPREVDGSHVLYHYLQKDLLQKDIWLFQMLTARLIVSLGIWLSPEIYRRFPIMVPFAVRDPKCRGDRAKGIPDQWGSPDGAGYFRDDNSLVKGIPRSMTIRNPANPIYNGLRMGTGFVASHVWRVLQTGGLASRDSQTYSFAPNLVWLPTQVSKLTDREGSFVQTYLQALSHKIYGSVDVPAGLRPVVEETWSKLPVPGAIPQQGLPDVSELNFFEASPAFLSRRLASVELVRDHLLDIRRGRSVSGKVIATRYGEGLCQLRRNSLKPISDALSAYCEAVRSS